jgi:hypothetical protein
MCIVFSVRKYSSHDGVISNLLIYVIHACRIRKWSDKLIEVELENCFSVYISCNLSRMHSLLVVCLWLICYLKALYKKIGLTWFLHLARQLRKYIQWLQCWRIVCLRLIMYNAIFSISEGWSYNIYDMIENSNCSNIVITVFMYV